MIATGRACRWKLSASRISSGVDSFATSTCATWPVACTPASVRPRRMRGHGLAAGLDTASSSACWTDSAVLLALPADEGAAVIFERQLVAGHGSSRAVRHRRSRAGTRRRSWRACPARCTSVGRSAPSPQAIVRRSSSDRARLRPIPAQGSAASTFSALAGDPVKAPGPGEGRACARSSSAALRRQSMRRFLLA